MANKKKEAKKRRSARKRKRELKCFCGGKQEVTAFLRQGGEGRYLITAKCPTCGSSYEFRNWPLSKREAQEFEKNE